MYTHTHILSSFRGAAASLRVPGAELGRGTHDDEPVTGPWFCGPASRKGLFYRYVLSLVYYL